MSTEATPPRQRRLRARKACEPCRERKRRCDGHEPCGPCSRFEYECKYVSVRPKAIANGARQGRRSPVPEIQSAPSQAESESAHLDSATDTQFQPLEANSGAAFVRKLALALDPVNAPRLQLFAWNLYLGARTCAHVPQARRITDIISRATMEDLAAVYLAKVDPCYGIIDTEILEQRIQTRWNPNVTVDSYDAVLCGVASLGFLCSRTGADSTELDLVATAKHILEQAPDTQPNLNIVTGWVLRVAYLRMTATPHNAWLASCTSMHVIEASGVLRTARTLPNSAADLWNRVIGIGRHMNIWLSFDLCRSRVVLPNMSPVESVVRPGNFTVELLSLLPPTESLDPEKNVSLSELQDMLQEIFKEPRSEPPSVLAQTNLALCIARRLRARDFVIAGRLLDKMLGLTRQALSCAEIMLKEYTPWHHDANVPFQIVCILLTVDSPGSIAQLTDAIRVLSIAVHIYNTDATREALDTACLLVLLHQKRKAADSRYLADLVRTYSPSLFGDTLPTDVFGPNSAGFYGTPSSMWFDDLMADIPTMQDFDVGQLFNAYG